MNRKPRVVVDTNVLISALLSPESSVAIALKHIQNSCILLASEDTIAELATVICKAKFDRYVDLEHILVKYTHLLLTNLPN